MIFSFPVEIISPRIEQEFSSPVCTSSLSVKLFFPETYGIICNLYSCLRLSIPHILLDSGVYRLNYFRYLTDKPVTDGFISQTCFIF